MLATLVPVVLHLPDGGEPRSPGIHCSAVLRCIAAESGILKPEYVESLDLVDVNQQGWWDGLNPRAKLIISMGMAWDQYYLPTLGTVVPHPGEMQLDGIYMSRDGESLDVIRHKLTLCLHEVKLTYKSIKTVGDLRTQWLWLAQLKAYCKAMRTLIAYLHVLFVCGDYKYPITPQLLVWRVEFTEMEIDDGWELITDYVRHRQAMEDFTL